jgi:hypothetical protein
VIPATNVGVCAYGLAFFVACGWLPGAGGLGPRLLPAQSVYRTVPPELRTRNEQWVPPTAFPEVGSEQRLWACLVSLDPINRTGVLRLEDRDRLLDFSLLPAAAVFYRAAPAALGDIPPGTMVQIWGYGDRETQLPRNVLRMSDAASVQAFSGLAYRVDQIDTSRKTFTATLVESPRSAPLPYAPVQHDMPQKVTGESSDTVTFSFNDQTDWYLGDRLAEAGDVAVGQQLRLNFIRKFYEGPPLITRCTEVWLDAESQDLAARKQYAAFLSFTRDRGFPLRVDAADDARKRVTVTLLETGLNDIFKEWQVGQVHDFSASTTQLRMWEPSGGQATPDRMFGVKLTELEELPIGYGCGGLRMTFTVPLLYEAYRAGTIIKLYPSGHPVPILPIEERLPKEFDTFLRP